MFERKEKDLLPLKYKVGDDVMGYHSGVSSGMLVIGKIVEAKQSTSYLDDNEYVVEIIPELCDGRKGCTYHIQENEIRLLDSERASKAIVHWKNEKLLMAEAHIEYINMMKELYPDKFED